MGPPEFSTLRLLAASLVLVSSVALTSCSDGDGSGSNPSDPAQLVGSCPDNFTAQEGGNGGFLSDGSSREFHVFLPGKLDTARPLFVSLTGTVSTELEFVSNERSQLESLVDSGWIVVAPFRTCTTENRTCRGIGPQGTNDGRFWEPWFDGAITQTNDEGPDVRFIDAMVKCVAASYPVDQTRIYGGGISAGGTMTHRNMMFNSDLFAGGVAASGNYRYLSQLPIEPIDPIVMDDSIVVVLWGGPEDTFGGTSFYDVETKLASEYYAAQSDVVTVSCSGTHGHVWPPAFTAWAAQTVLSHPKGTPVEDFELTTPPDGFSCVVGVYTDH